MKDLRLLTIPHWGFDNNLHQGQLLVHRELAIEVQEIFEKCRKAHFPIAKMRLIDHYQGSDDASMKDNNTSAFNCRPVCARRDIWSKHAYGRAIDINPVQNPYIAKAGVMPPGGAAYVDRNQNAAGMLKESNACLQAFLDKGWRWGGHWKHRKDYQHLEKNRN